jgi:hypothetical protein
VKTFSKEVMNILCNLNTAVNMQDHKADLDMMTATNYKQELKRRGTRSEDVVRRHTAMGLGAEIALSGTGYFVSKYPITENAVGLSYVQRKQDMECEGVVLEIKSMNSNRGVWYISDKQCESVLRSAKVNDMFLVVEYFDLGGLKYRYKPRFLVDAKEITRYIVASNGQYGGYKFANARAVKDGNCVDLRDIENDE